MSSTRKILNYAVASLMSAGAALSLGLPAHAQSGPQAQRGVAQAGDVQEQLARALEVLQTMKADPQLTALLGKAQGVFIVPSYARGGVGLAARGGEGVMLARQGQKWSSPLFYNVGGVSIGLQAGLEVGPVVMLLMNQKAVNEFRKENNVALTADAGLTLVNYNAGALAAAGQGDIIVWTNTKGAFATAAVGIVDIHFDDSENRAYYRKPVKAADVLSGKVTDAQPGALARALEG